VRKAEFGSPDHPLELGGLKIPCYVLDDGTRVLGQNQMITALGMSYGGSGGTGGDRLAKFVGQTRLEPYVQHALADRTANPIKFRVKSGNVAYGYEATILADICEAVLKARDAGVFRQGRQP